MDGTSIVDGVKYKWYLRVERIVVRRPKAVPSNASYPTSWDLCSNNRIRRERVEFLAKAERRGICPRTRVEDEREIDWADGVRL